MKFAKLATAFIAATLTTFVLAAGFYTQQVLAKQAEIGVTYPPSLAFQTFLDNLTGLAPSYGIVLSFGLLIAFPVAAGVKRILKPLARVAYPIAGATAVFSAIYLIENVVASGGVGALAGARGALGLSLQMLAGFIGGAAFEMLRPR